MIAARPTPIGLAGLSSLVEETDPSHRLVALRHAAIRDDPSLLGDDPNRPTFAILIREVERRPMVFAAGRPDAAVPWLAERFAGRPITLAAPSSWYESCPGRARIGSNLTRRPGHRLTSSGRPESTARRLGLEDMASFASSAPPWAWAPWGTPTSLIEHGGAFGIPHQGEFIALAWAYEADRRYVKIGVATHERFRRLGLGRDVAKALIAEIIGGGRIPLWTTEVDNLASNRMAESLGFGREVEEPLLFWTPGAP